MIRDKILDTLNIQGTVKRDGLGSLTCVTASLNTTQS